MKYLLEIIKRTIIPFLLFTFIFTVYFSSAQGIHSLLEFSHYFTTEALLKYDDLDMSHFQNDPHYFVWQDLYYRNEQTLGVRGYIVSLFSIPIHIFSKLIYQHYSLINFPKNGVSDVPNFGYELSIAAFFSAFTVIGLFFFWKVCLKITKNHMISSLTILIFSFGTYSWKYAPVIMRHGIQIFLMGIYVNSIYELILGSKIKIKNLLSIFIVVGLMFGIDPFNFLVLFIVLFVLIVYKIIFTSRLNNRPSINRNIVAGFIVFAVLIAINIALNIYWYGTLYFTQQDKMPIFINSFGNRWGYGQILSTPIFPTLYYIFLSFGKLPLECFKNFDGLPQAFIAATSVEFAKRYNFFGLFMISPFLFLSLCQLFLIRRLSDSLRIFIIILFSIFLSGIILTLKNIGFWGGPQYDVRYFYPYTVLLIVPIAMTIKSIIRLKNILYRSFYLLFLTIIVFWSLFSGWVGVISMLKPAQTGERRIWVDLITFWSQYRNFSLEEYLNATFMNRNNAWIAISISIAIYLVFLILVVGNMLLKQLHTKKLLLQHKKHS